MSAPDPPHWILNTCFGVFRTICVHLGPFGCLTKLEAKRSELVQKFVRRSRVGVFHDERTRSTPLDPKLMFCCVSYHLGPFGCLTKLGAKQAELVQKFVPRSCIGIVRNECTRSTHWTLNSCFGELRTIWVHLGTFGCLTKLGEKWAELVQKFVPRSRVGVFRDERTRSTPLDPKL